MVSTSQNATMVLSIGIFFTLIIVGLSAHLPAALYQGLVAQGVPTAAAAKVAAAQLASPLTSWPWRILELAGTFATAAFSYHLLENPIRHSRRLAADRLAVALVLVVCIATSWTASLLVAHFITAP